MSCSIFSVAKMSWGQEAVTSALSSAAGGCQHILTSPGGVQLGLTSCGARGASPAPAAAPSLCAPSHTNALKFRLMNTQMSPCARQTSEASRTPSSYFFSFLSACDIFVSYAGKGGMMSSGGNVILHCAVERALATVQRPNFKMSAQRGFFKAFQSSGGQTDSLDTHTQPVPQDVFQQHA